MKWFEEKLSGFKITYLHDPFSCSKCIDGMSPEDFVDYESRMKLNDSKNSGEWLESQENVYKKRKNESIPDIDSEFQKPLENCSANIKAQKQSSHSKGVQVLSMNSIKNKYAKTKKSDTKKTPSETPKISPVKKHLYSPAKKQQESKVPGKGTLKRRRWFVNELNQKDDNYEDDIFEDQKFGHFQNLFEDETDSGEKYEDLKTPVFPFSLSPREMTPSPPYKDCYSPSELSRSRKGAEEYQYRRRRRRKRRGKKLVFGDKNQPAQVNPQSRDDDVQKKLEEVAKILSRQKGKTSDSDDDPYFSDVLGNCSSVYP